MLFIGKYNNLTVERLTSVGLYLSDPEGEEVLLPNRYVTDQIQIGGTVSVFIYNDSEDRLIATTRRPLVLRNEFGYLEVKDVTPSGAFLDWGLEKDLFVPFREQLVPMRAGTFHIVFVYLDRRTNRLLASSKWRNFTDNDRLLVAEGDEVDLLVAERTDLGYNVIVNHFHQGLVYYNEIFRRVGVGDKLKGYVKQIREDNKLDISLEKPGYAQVEDQALRILALLRERNGYLALSDKSSPEIIVSELEMSKKTFKKAIGGLYRQGLIAIEEDGVRLL